MLLPGVSLLTYHSCWLSLLLSASYWLVWATHWVSCLGMDLLLPRVQLQLHISTALSLYLSPLECLLGVSTAPASEPLPCMPHAWGNLFQVRLRDKEDIYFREWADNRKAMQRVRKGCK